MKIESSLSFVGVSTFLKKFKILALFAFLAGVFAGVLPPFFPPALLLITGRFDFEFGRGVRGLVDIVDVRVRGADVPLGGVGGLPVEGRTGLEEGLAFSRGLRNIACPRDNCGHPIAIVGESVSDIEEGGKVECCLHTALMAGSRMGNS